MEKNYKKILVLQFVALLLLLSANSVMAQDRIAGFDLEFNGGLRVDQFDWNIAGNTAGTNPNILSELTWDDLEIYEVNSKARLIMINSRSPVGGMAMVRINYGEIQDGENQDSDFESDNRGGEWSRSNNQADDGDVFDFTVGGGLVFRSRADKLMILPMLGYSYHAQNLTIHDGYQTISRDNPFSSSSADDPPPVGPIAGLNSAYDAVWDSFWIGVELELNPTEIMQIDGFVELHAASYRADANWNLRSDLEHPVSFTHDSNDAVGFVTGIGVKFGSDPLLVNVDLLYQTWEAEDGVDIIYFSDGTTGASRLNEVNWDSFSVSAGLTVSF